MWLGECQPAYSEHSSHRVVLVFFDSEGNDDKDEASEGRRFR